MKIKKIAAIMACVASLSLNACTTTKKMSLNDDSTITTAKQHWGEQFRKDVTSKTAALQYGKALRANGQTAQSVAVLEKAVMAHPNDPEVSKELGKSLAMNGNYDRALVVLNNALQPAKPDWEILSTMGAAYDQMGKPQYAQAAYIQALKIKPNEPSVLSNLGLSYALSNNLDEAEQVLKQAAAQPDAEQQVRQNLALVLALQGRFNEAEQVAMKDLPPDQARQNVAMVRQMISSTDRWKQIKNENAETTASIPDKPSQKAVNTDVINAAPQTSETVKTTDQPYRI